MIHNSLATRVGLPITLSVILIAVCRRLGIQHVHGVGAPGHFVCKYHLPMDAGDTDGQWIQIDDNAAEAKAANSEDGFTLFYMDPHGGGALIEPLLMHETVAARVPPGTFLKPLLECVGNHQVWTRVCANLNHAYDMKLRGAQSFSMSASERNRVNLFRLSILSLQHQIQLKILEKTGVRPAPPTELLTAFLRDVALFDIPHSRDKVHIRERGPLVPNATTLSELTCSIFMSAFSQCEEYIELQDLLKELVCPDLKTPPLPKNLPLPTRFRVGQLVKRLGSNDVGVIFGFARGINYCVLWSGHQTLGICGEREMGTSFERSYTLVVKHHALGRYFRRRCVARRGNPFYEPNGILLALYGPQHCMGKDEEEACADLALGEGYNQENAMRK